MFLTQCPRSSHPTRRAEAATFEREHIAHHLAQAALKGGGEAHTLFRVAELVLEGIDVHRYETLLVQEAPHVLIDWQSKACLHPQSIRQHLYEALCFRRSVSIVHGLVSHQGIVIPERYPVLAPVTGQGPPGQRLTR